MTKLNILYGMMATGNGHISKGRVLIPELRQRGASVTCYFSGKFQKLFDMDVFSQDSPYKISDNFNTVAGKDGNVSPLKTLYRHATKLKSLRQEIAKLDISAFDQVISDYEVVTSWAAKKAGRPAIGIGHQCAFHADLPGMPRKSLFSKITRGIVPVQIPIGLHWERFGPTVLPPMIAAPDFRAPDPSKILVNMNFELPEKVAEMVRPFGNYRFHIYSHAIDAEYVQDNVVFHRPSRMNFLKDLSDCAGAISNAGFEFPSEVLQLGRKILVKPQQGQAEQANNGFILNHLGYGQVMETLDRSAVASWLERDMAIKITFPPVAASIADWVLEGADASRACDMAERLWSQTTTFPVQIAKP